MAEAVNVAELPRVMLAGEAASVTVGPPLLEGVTLSEVCFTADCTGLEESVTVTVTVNGPPEVVGVQDSAAVSAVAHPVGRPE